MHIVAAGYCSTLGDVNGDGTNTVLDIVQLSNCVANNNCNTLPIPCAGDINNDGNFNIMDIVLLTDCVLVENCGDI